MHEQNSFSIPSEVRKLYNVVHLEIRDVNYISVYLKNIKNA